MAKYAIKDRTMVWRHGVVLEWEGGALGEVVKMKLKGRDAFHIRTQGKNRKEMMTLLLKTFRELHSEYKGIKYKEKVPCTCDGCKTGKNEQHYFEFDDLIRRLDKGRYEVECNKSFDSVNVLGLLENNFVFETYKKGRTLQLKENVTRKNLRVVNLFLASSDELKHEREGIEIALSRRNDAMRKQDFLINLRTWEDGQYIGYSRRTQDNYNLEIKQCEFFVMIFYSKVGKYSLEEFELVKLLFEEKRAPRICVFQKNIDLPKNQGEVDANSRYNFLKQLKGLEHFLILFENTHQLVHELEKVIDKLLEDDDFVQALKVE